MSEHRIPPAKGSFRSDRPPRRDRPGAESALPPLDLERTAAELKRFLEIVLRETQLALQYEINSPVSGESPSEQAELVISFHGVDEPLLLENNAELLLALEHVAHRWLHLNPRLHDHVRFDCGDYRAMRLEELKLSARVAAQRVRETGQSFRFNPMSARERRIIHLELSGAPGVRTMSEGFGERRQLVIYPASAKK